MPDPTDTTNTTVNADNTPFNNEQNNSTPTTPQKVTVNRTIDEHITAYTEAYEYIFNPERYKVKINRSIEDLINTDNYDDYTRYNLTNINHLFPAGASSLLARFVVVFSQTAPLKMEILFSRINELESGFGGITHAHLACGREIKCSCLSAGDIEFIKKNEHWTIKSISNKTGHFLCNVGALLLPLQLLLNENLWDKKVILRQVINSNMAIDGPESIELKSTEFEVDVLKEKCLPVVVSISPAAPLSPIIEVSTTQDMQSNQHAPTVVNAKNLSELLDSSIVERSAPIAIRTDKYRLFSISNSASTSLPPLPLPPMTARKSLFKITSNRVEHKTPNPAGRERNRDYSNMNSKSDEDLTFSLDF